MSGLGRAVLLAVLVVVSAAGVSLGQTLGPERPDRPAVPGATVSGRPGSDAASGLGLAPRPESPGVAGLNPMRLIGDAARLIPGASADAAVNGGSQFGGPSGPVPPAGPGASGEDRGGLSVALNIMVLLTVITLIPSVMLMTTSFIRILIVLGLLRQAIGAQSVPPAQVITALTLFMTLLVMSPTIERVWDEAVGPWQRAEISSYEELWERARRPVRDFMFDQIEATDNWSSVYLILNYRGVDTSEPSSLTRADVDTATLSAAFMLSELKVAFLLGFRVYLPFLVIDMVIASILISMSMMMLPPVLVSLPFKLLLFVLVDGWALVVGSLLESFVQDGTSSRLSAEAAALPLVLMLAVPLRGARAGPGGGGAGGVPALARDPRALGRGHGRGV